MSSVTQSCQTLCNPMDCSTPGSPVHHQLPELTQTHVIELVMPSSHLIFFHPLLLLPSIFPNKRIFFNESVLHIRQPTCYLGSFKVVKSCLASCLTLCNPMDCSRPASSVHGILQVRILEWVAISYFRGSSPDSD